MRTEWVERRSKDPIPTQIYYGRQGVVTEEMEYVARRELTQREKARKLIHGPARMHRQATLI